MPSVQFIPLALAKLRPSPPSGDGWQYELKFDGYRIQLHKAGQTAALFGKYGGEFTKRFPTIAAAVLALPVRSCIIDGELIAAGAHGEPDFLALARLGLEGIVAKRKDAPYRSGTRSGWVKVKTSEWRAANRWRGEFFEKA